MLRLRSLRSATWKHPILTFDLTLTWHVTSILNFRKWFGSVSSRSFECRLVRLLFIDEKHLRSLSPNDRCSHISKTAHTCRSKNTKTQQNKYVSLHPSVFKIAGGGVGFDPPPCCGGYRNSPGGGGLKHCRNLTTTGLLYFFHLTFNLVVVAKKQKQTWLPFSRYAPVLPIPQKSRGVASPYTGEDW